MSSVFLSHSSSDKVFTRRIAADLRRYGHTIWIDEAEINIGDSLIGKIRQGIDRVDFVAAILSYSSIKSEWVNKELEIASNREIEEKKVIVLPILLDNVQLPGFLKGKLYADFRDERKYDEMLLLLLRSLGNSKIIKTQGEDLTKLKADLEDAKKVISIYQKSIITHHTQEFQSKSQTLQYAIDVENENHPIYAPINNVYAFEFDEYPVTIGWLLQLIAKAKKRNKLAFYELTYISNYWEQCVSMLEAFLEMLSSLAQKTDTAIKLS